MAISGLNKQEAITLLQRQGLTTAQQAQILSSAGLLQTTQMLNASLVEEAVLNSKISGEKAEQILTELGLIEAKTGNLIVTKECTVAEVAQALATKGIVGADAEAILSQLGLATANTTTTASFTGLTTAIKANVSAMAKWLVTNPVGWCVLAVGAIYGLSKAYDALTVSEKEMVEAHEDSVEKVKQSISEYEELEQELETIQQTYGDNKKKLEELYALRENQTLTQAEQDYLKELEGQNEKLRQQIEFKKALVDIEAKEAEDKAVETLGEKTQDGNYTGTNSAGEAQYEKITDAEKIERNTSTITALTDDLKAYEKVIQKIPLSQEEVNKYTKQLSQYQEQLNGITGNSFEDDANREFYQNQIDGINKLLDGTLTYEEYEKAVSSTQESVKGLVSENTQLLEKVEPLNDAIKSTSGKNYELKKANDEIIANAKDATIAFNNYTDSLNGTANALDVVGEKEGSTTDTQTLTFKAVFNAEEFSDTKEKLLELAKSGELTPYTLSSTKEYKTLLDQTGLTAEQVYKKIMKVAKKSMDISDWQTTLDNSRKNIISLKEMKNALKEDGISSVSGDVISNFPELIGYLESESELRKGINGLIGDYEAKATEAYFNLVQDSEVYYSNLKKNESDKLNTASKTINSIVNANKTLVEQLGGAYNVDLKNFKSVAQAKAQLEQQLIINSAKAWSKYYKVQLDASKNTAKVVANGDFNSGGTGGSDSIKAYEEASKAQNAANASAKAYNEAINSLKKITSTTINPQITSPDPTDTDKAKKSTTKFSQAIDWCAQTLSKLSKTIDLYSAKLENNTNSVKTQIKYYKELLNAQNNIVKGYAKTESKYKSTYNKALKKLSKSDQKKVKDGTYTIEQFSGTTKKSGKKSKAEKRYNNIQKALEARDNYLDAQTDSVNAKNQLQQYAEDLAAVRWENATEKVEKLNDKVSLLDTRMSNVSGYKAKNKVLQEQLDLQKKILTKQQEAYDDTQSDANSYYKKISSKYKKNKNKDGTIKTKGITDQTQLKYIKIYNAYVKQLAEDSIKLAQAEEDYKASVQEATITRAENIKADYDNKLALIDAKANELDNQIALAEAKGQVASVEYYKQLGQNSDQRMTQLKSEKTQLEKQLATLRPYSDEWYEVKQAVIEVDEEIANETVNAVENINKQIEAMDELTNKKNDYITHVSDSLSWFEGLVDEEDMYDDDGNFTDKGLAVLQSKLGRIEASRVRQENALKRIQELDKQYEQGLITEAQYLTARNEWEQQYQDEISTTTDIQNELNDVTKKGLEMQSDTLSELIEKKKEMINLDKSEYDYQKSIAEKTKNITDLQKQLAMLEGDNSEEGKAKRQKLEVELKDAQEDLANAQYEKYVERLEDALGSLQDRFDALIEKLDNLSGEEAEKQVRETVEGNEANVEKGKEEVLSDAGAGTEFLNKDTDDLFSGSADDIGKKLDIANDYAEKTFNATVDGNDGTADLEVTLEEALGKVDLNNQKKYLAGDAKNKSALNKYIMSQGYSAMDEEQMVTLKDAILNSKYSEGMDEGLRETLTNITSANNLKKDKDANSSNNKNAILKAYKYTQIQEYIDKNAIQPTGKNIDNYKTNKYIYEKTGKVLDADGLHGLGKLLGVERTDGTLDLSDLYKALIQSGYSDGGIVKKAISVNGDDGLATLKVGEAVLTPVQTTAFTKLAENIVPFNNLIGDIVERPDIPTVDRGAGTMTNNTIESVNFEFTLPNVTDKESLLNMIRNDKEVQRAFQNSTVGLLMSGNKQFNSRRL